MIKPISWLFLTCYSGLLLYGSLQSPEKLPETVMSLHDKVLHSVAYFLLFISSFWTFSQSLIGALQQHRFLSAVVYSLFLGTLIEVLQSFFPERTPEWGDIIFNGVGVLLGALIIKLNAYLRPSLKD